MEGLEADKVFRWNRFLADTILAIRCEINPIERPTQTGIHHPRFLATGAMHRRVHRGLYRIFFIKIYSGLDKDLDQWVFHPQLFNLMSILLFI